ncbi:peptidase domain-containing ABC transporter [Dictyobacter formicarum]|uniref:NHLP family bacteriocin export ABC transporter peptidase/permease/ATPase n=1 Tax=Dictyobacter formicarum TaxID=2778368 RepID=A0ABQ3V7Y4_9CHLR|nr:peptidase domain-containing ABC transporter [Dictyobacter formicarum]GHO82064.1 NHLP family bacteriocin export ABC transporter peptidase/permease/ATPase [Dictyobacter formicarum]
MNASEQKTQLLPKEGEKKGVPYLQRSIVNRIWKKRVPVILQMSEVECGLACLAMIMTYHGRQTTISELRANYGAGRDGISALNLVKAARNMGMISRAVALQRNDFKDVALPAIIHWEFNHFLIVENWTPDQVTVVDPASGRRQMNAEEFNGGFTGIVLMLEPGMNFHRRKIASSLSLRMYAVQAVRQAPGALLQVILASIILQGIGLLPPILTQTVIDKIIPFHLTNAMILLGAGMLMMLFSQAFISLLREWLLIYVRARIDTHMMLSFFEHLLLLPYSFFQQRSSGDLLTRMGSNTIIRDTLSGQVISTCLDGSMVILYLAILLVAAPTFGLLALVIGLLQIVLMLSVYRTIASLAAQELTAQGKSQGYMAEALAGIATLKAAGAEYSAHDRWTNLFFDQLNISTRRGYISTIASTAMMLLRGFAPMALLWVGATQVLNGTLSIGTMLALSSLATSFLSPLSSLVSSGQQLQIVQAHLERLADIMTAEPEQHAQTVKSPPKLAGHIRLENVSFRYSPETPRVLHSINLTIASGQKVAIVGRTGSGKSTLGKLLLGLYIPGEGQIYYDGIPLQELQYQEVRRQFGVVLQESAIFSGTIMENILFNNPHMDKDYAVRAAQMAAIHDDIVRMPLGYETPVAEGGSALSGGQRQRLSLARAIAHHPAILLLDEATSNLDVVTEQLVAQNLESLPCTQIIIAHRLSTIRNADLILVMDQGTIVESGTHQDLLLKNGFYTNLIKQQMEKKSPRPLLRKF